jgi:hypothetical protein
VRVQDVRIEDRDVGHGSVGVEPELVRLFTEST